jgi:RHS repeat-associated protein
MKLIKSRLIGGLSRVKVLSIVLLFVVLLYPNGMKGKALILEKSPPLGTLTSGEHLRPPEPARRNRVNFLPSSPDNPNLQAARMLAGMTAVPGGEGPLGNGPGSNHLFLPLIQKDFNPALFAVVPHVLNLTQAEAETAILAAQLTLGTVTQESSPTVPAGKVKSQNPGAGLYLAKGTPVDLVISTGPAMVNVPDVVGQPLETAEGLITSAGLLVGTVLQEYSDTVALGNVIRQSPAAGTVVAEMTAVGLTVSLGTMIIPPDPSTVAPSVDPTVATTLARSTEFLYAGPSPIQTGVAPGTIEARRAAVIRGKVLDKEGNPLPGVVLTILQHPEFGQTLSRADGMFDMAVNGGGPLTIQYRKTDYLEAQRQINVPWQNFIWTPEVVLIALDTQVTAVDLTAALPFQVAQGSPVTDADGTRQATLLVPQGTTAQLLLPDGSTRSISSLNIRATEYTVGPNGPKAMPAELPPASGYTYCVELTADEALAAGAVDVRFSQPLYFYLEDFIGFPVGGAVPTGYYDRRKGQWIASENGRVINILSISGGLAQIDTDGDGTADTGLGISYAERQQLAALFPQPPRQIWRVPMTHFTPWDCNWPYGPPPDAVPPPGDPPRRSQPEDESCESSGSIIDCQNQTLGERVPVAGTPFTLNYRSSRVPGGVAGRVLDIPVTGSSLPPSLTAVRLEVEIAGKIITQSFPLTPNLSYQFSWDGTDVYGRKVYGLQPATVKTTYVYPASYYPVPFDFVQAFSRVERLGATVNARGGDGIRVEQSHTITIGNFDAAGLRFGGWTLNAHHVYDPLGQTLYLGTGEQRSALNQAWIVDTVAGNGNFCNDYSAPCGDGGQATDAQIYPWGVDVGPDGSLYITDEGSSRIWRVRPDGIINHVAGILDSQHYWCDNATDPCGDGGPALQARFVDIYNNAVGPDGSIYIADEAGNRIRKVSPAGIITTVAGTGEQGFAGDGGPATQAKFNEPYSVKVAPDGSIYIADEYNHRIRRVGTDGIITTVAGNGTVCDNPRTAPCGDGGPATQAAVGWPIDVAVGPDGSLYIPVLCRIRKVSPDGIISTVAGTGECGYTGDGGPAIQANIRGSLGIAVGPDGTILFTDEGHIRRVGPDGIISTIAGVAGYYQRGYAGDNGPATTAKFYSPWYIAIGPDGEIYIADAGNRRLRRLRRLLPGLSDSDLAISSSDGREVYVFTQEGRHLRTVNTLTGIAVYQFGYDPDGRLVTVQDADGKVIAIERDTSGNPTAIVGPYGQRTTLALDGNGYLSDLTNPAGETTSFQYSSDGLMTGMTTPRGHAYNFTYDALGRLIRDDDPAGGYQALARSEFTNGYEVTRTTALGRTTTYRVENLPTGDKQMTNTFPDGTQATALQKTDGTQTATVQDGTVTTLKLGPDPRFGMQSPIPQTFSIQTPGGLTYSAGLTRSVSLSNPNDPMSLTSQTDSLVVNSRTYQSQYTAATRQKTSLSPEGRQTVTTFDALGRVVQKERTGIEPIYLSYNANGQLTTISQGTTGNLRNITLGYSSGGYVSSLTDPLSRAVSFEYDLAGRVTRQILPGGREVMYGYDSNGNMTSITPPARPNHVFSYTPIDAVEEYTPPPAGPGSGETTYTYNEDRQLIQVTRPDGRSISLGYDTAGRLSSQTIQRGTTGFTYDAQTGNLTSITAPDGEVLSFTYDGSLVKGVSWQGVVQGSLGLTYDNNFRTISQTVNGADAVAFAYDADGLLTQAGAMSISRNAQNGLVTGTSLGAVTDTRQYNTFGELSNYSANANALEVLRFQHTRDNLGRIIEKTETFNGVPKSFGYTYDAAGRLAEVQEGGSPVATYTYDANGNRQSYTGPGGTTSYTYDDQDRLLALISGPLTQTYTYTGNGELASKTDGTQITTYQYDELGNLVAVTLPNGTPVEYLIDGRNRRIGKKVDTVLTQGFLYKDRLNPVAELDGSGAIVARFVYATKKNIPNYMVRGGVAYLIISDHLGSVRLVVNTTTGAITQRLDYDSFGNLILDTNPGFQPFGFAGGLYDRDTKLTRFGVRDYDAETGRWTAKDPIGFDGGDGNLYAYVQNNPVMLIDPPGTGAIGDIVSSVHETLKAASNKAKDWVKEKLEEAKKTAEDKFGSDNVNNCLDTAWNFLSNAACAFLTPLGSEACTIGTGATDEETAKDIYRGIEHLEGKGERWEKLKGVEF